MKLIAINGSPRTNFNTATLVKEAMRGAEDTGAEIEYLDLYKVSYRGCISCFMCKRIDDESCVCQIKDEIQPVFERIHEADALVIGSPVYFGDVSASTEAFLERLVFPALTYDDFSSRVYTGKVNCGLILTMNLSDASIYDHLIEQKKNMLARLHGNVRTYVSTFTVQFDDYDRYHSAALDGPARIAHQAQQFPKDLQAAYDMGRELITSASTATV